MIHIRRARPADAHAIATVHVTAWRNAYAGILSDAYLANLSIPRLAAEYRCGIEDRGRGQAMFVATAGGEDRPADFDAGESTVVGFASGARARRAGLACGEVATLYVLDDYRERGLGRRLLRAMAAHLCAVGCRSAMLWVLADNPSRWFYHHLGGRAVAHETIRVAGQPVEQVAILWDPIESLLAATATAPEG